jgi:SSS family solute:Na+ symporter
MDNAFYDVAVFFGFLIAVLVIGIGMSRRGKGAGENSESYFLAGRSLPWWLIGFSLIAANISTEQFVGMSGNAANYIGLAVASYEWIAALSLVIIAFLFLPRFLKAGIYTIPQFLETRYNKATRTVMSLIMIVVLVVVNVVAVTYSAAKAYSVFFADFGLTEILVAGEMTLAEQKIPLDTLIPLNLTTFCWIIGVLAATYVFIGGLKACAWADLLQGSALIFCGGMILYFALGALGSADKETISTAIQANAEQVGWERERTEVAIKMTREEKEQEQSQLLEKVMEQDNAYQRFTTLNESKLRMNLPWRNSFLPITALLFGIWIPNLYYWGLNQYIMQRTLGSQSLSQGQKGVVFAASLKLLIPFIVIFPGIIAFNLYHDSMKRSNVEEAKFQELMTEYKGKEKQQLFSFDEGFVKLQPDMAVRMLEFNREQTNFTLPENYRAEPIAALEAMKKEFKKRWYWEQPKYGEFSGYDYDSSLSLLIRRLVPPGGLQGFVLAALLGAILSTLAAMYNATSTIFTMDIYQGCLHRSASERTLVAVGRIAVLLTMILGCYLAPMVDRPEFGGVFWFIQEFQGFISPGVLAAFLFGFLVSRAPRMCGLVALLLNPIIYGALMLFASDLSFLDRMSITFVSIIAVMTLMRLVSPLKVPYKSEATTTIDLRQSKSAMVVGVIVVAITIALYAYFWDYNTPLFEGMFESLLGK